MASVIESIRVALGLDGSPEETLSLPPGELRLWARGAPLDAARSMLARALKLSADYGAACELRWKKRREAEAQHCEDAADRDGSTIMPVDPRVFEAIDEDVMSPWLGTCRKFGVSLSLLPQAIGWRISTLRDVLIERGAFTAELPPLLDRARTLALAAHEARETFQAHARKVDSLGKLANISDHKATQSLRAKLEAAERELETTKAEVRGLDPDAA